MPTPRQAHRTATRILSLTMVGIGVAIIVRTALAGGGGGLGFLLAAMFFVLAVLTYVEGASLHQERAGSTVFARYAFNELWSFVAGWAILLDYVILMAIAAITAANYLGAFWAPLAHGTVEAVVAI